MYSCCLTTSQNSLKNAFGKVFWFVLVIHEEKSDTLVIKLILSTGCPRMIYTVLEKYIRNIKSTLNVMTILSLLR